MESFISIMGSMKQEQVDDLPLSNTDHTCPNFTNVVSRISILVCCPAIIFLLEGSIK